MTEQVRRATRLVEIERRLRANPAGLSVRQLAEDLGYSPRTIQRDLNALESELGVPLVEGNSRRWRLLPGSTPIGAVRFTLFEARALYIATRILLRHADHRDDDGIGAMEKLADAMPPPLSAQIRSSAKALRSRPERSGQMDVLRTLTSAWAGSLVVAIQYRSQSARELRATDLHPYLLEPSTNGQGLYIIGYSTEHDQVRTFKVDRIASAELTGDAFVPDGLDEITDKLSRSWDVVFGDDEHHVVVEFTSEAAGRVAESAWHPSQRITWADDGCIRLELRIPSFLDFVPWVRSWGPAARVVSPPELVDLIASSLREAAAQYR
ncbi:MAG: WYL domain-containing protein [Dehalococcoidia bacterium]|nr:WYL domain-containing protein [Dehalococcoidia bacterium]